MSCLWCVVIAVRPCFHTPPAGMQQTRPPACSAAASGTLGHPAENMHKPYNGAEHINRRMQYFVLSDKRKHCAATKFQADHCYWQGLCVHKQYCWELTASAVLCAP